MKPDLEISKLRRRCIRSWALKTPWIPRQVETPSTRQPVSCRVVVQAVHSGVGVGEEYGIIILLMFRSALRGFKVSRIGTGQVS